MLQDASRIIRKPQGAPGCPRKPRNATKGSGRPQEVPGNCRKLQEAPGGTRRLQEATGSARRPQKTPGGPRRSQKVSGSTRELRNEPNLKCFTSVPIEQASPGACILSVLRMFLSIVLFLWLQSYVCYVCSYRLGVLWGTSPWCFTCVPIDCPSPVVPILSVLRMLL